jgi:hypothetical protein
MINLYPFCRARFRVPFLLVISGLIFVFSFISCENIPEYRIASIEEFKYGEGETLIYTSDRGNTQYITVDQVKRKVDDDSNSGAGTTVSRFEVQEVVLHFQHEESLIAKHDSLFQLWEECRPEFGSESCDTLYDYRYYDRKIELWVTAEPVNRGRRSFKWKKLTFNDGSVDFKHLVGFNIDGTPYDYVLNFVPEPETIDSTMNVRSVFFSFRHGILRYEYQDGEVFSLRK